MTPVAMGEPTWRGLVVAEELALAVEVADARGGSDPLASGQADGVGFGSDLLRDPAAVAGQHRECLGRDPVG
jgi:hypothetical protein